MEKLMLMRKAVGVQVLGKVEQLPLCFLRERIRISGKGPSDCSVSI